MTVHPKLLAAAIEALRIVLRFEYPADALISQYLREHRSFGPTERAFIADAVFGVLRHKRVLDHLTHEATPRRLLLAWLAKFGGAGARELGPVLRAEEGEWLASVRGARLDGLPLGVQAELPDWVLERLAPRFPEAELLRLGEVLQQPAPLDLRVNTIQIQREAVLNTLGRSGMNAVPTRYSPMGVRVAGRPPISQHALFLNGAIEVQDEGSQLVGYLVAPRRHELVVDFCAGAGGKSLLLGAMMHSQGRLYAFDVSAARLARLKPRLKRSGLSNVHPHVLRNEHDTKVKRLAGKIDRVLVDAPCSGLGTLRRNPDLKWRQSPAAVDEMRVRQASILRAAASLLKPGGRLIYATCSLLEEENEAIVAAFLAENASFRALSCRELLQQHSIELDTGEQLRLWPHVHGTDGFFAAALERHKA